MAKKNTNNRVKKESNFPKMFPMWGCITHDKYIKFKMLTDPMEKPRDCCYITHYEYLQICNSGVLTSARTMYKKSEKQYVLIGLDMNAHFALMEFRHGLRLRDLLEREFNVQIVNYKNIIIYNKKDEIVCYSPCLEQYDEIYDTRNNHGVQIATAEGNFSYNFLTRVLCNIPLKALDEEIEYYIDTDKNLKIKLCNHMYKPDKTILRHMKQNGQILD